MKVKQWIPIVLALVLGLAALKLTRDRMNRVQAPSAATANFAERVVATRDIGAGEQITPGDLALGKVAAADAAPAGTFNAVADLKDRVAATGIVKGQLVLESLLAPSGAGAGVQAMIKPGMRAITIQVNEWSGLAGLLTPGCKVDIISVVTTDEKEGQVARTIVQNVEVRAVGKQIVAPTAGDKPETQNNGQPLPPPTSVTLLVTPEQAEQIQLASSGGKPWLSLRNATDADPVESAGVSMADLRGDRSKKGTEEEVKAEAQTPTPTTPTTIDPFAETIPPVATTSTAGSGHKSAEATAVKTRTVTIIRGTKEQTFQMSVDDPATTTAVKRSAATGATADADTDEATE
jgi:pilus assembly protein CpaB